MHSEKMYQDTGEKYLIQDTLYLKYLYLKYWSLILIFTALTDEARIGSIEALRMRAKEQLEMFKQNNGTSNNKNVFGI